MSGGDGMEDPGEGVAIATEDPESVMEGEMVPSLSSSEVKENRSGFSPASLILGNSTLPSAKVEGESENS
jgi:hypothetical protein